MALLTKFELDLAKVPGVKSARVVGDGEPSEIHIVASAERSPKQVVRDVLSLAQAGYDLSLDHRIVSVVQLEDTRPDAAASNGDSPRRNRAALSYIVQMDDVYGRRVDLGVEWPDGSTTGGSARLGESSHSRARAGAEVMVQAINEKLKDRRISIDIEGVYLVRGSDGTDTVTVRLLVYEAGRSQGLTGSALSDGDVVTGAARATLQALNRRLAQI